MDIPLGVFTCVTGVSGSGKSSIVNEILYKRLARDLNHSRTSRPGKHKDILGVNQLDKVINIDQSPIGRTPRSNPATYTGVFDMIRDLFASTVDAKERGYKKGRFSFNVKGGRCEACAGMESSKLKCTSWLMFMCLAKYVRESAIIGKLWRLNIRAKIFTMS